MIHFLRHHSRAVISASSLFCGGGGFHPEIMQREPQRIKRLWDITIKCRKSLPVWDMKSACLKTLYSFSTKEMETSFKFWRMVTDEGLFVNPVVPGSQMAAVY